MRRLPGVAWLALSIALLFGGGTAHARKMYRWVDEQGNVFFSDVVPPDQVQHKRETLSNKARVVDSVEKAKTIEELEQQKRLDALHKHQEKLIVKQSAEDKVLLSTYRSLDDMQTAFDKKRQGFDADRKLHEGNLQLLDKQLRSQQQQAADFERNGKTVPAKLLSDIDASKRQTDAVKQTIQRNQWERERYEADFKADIARFQFLTQGSEAGNTSTDKSSNTAADDAIGLYLCKNADDCQQAWKIAAGFVDQHATTAKDVETDSLIVRAAPLTDDDMSLSLSLIGNQHQQQIFLDIRCKASVIGSALCASHKAQAIRRSFVPYIQSMRQNR
ncbi:MAG: DUF4124 domain-containing protein [Methylomonas sp.]|nr:DUF4124 domain-containing protein [Methylomonas sp.]PPD20887.1 MAG: DUF4124 domain-containing protein [Methylomonas sp.]PPD25612.1 MAG: DUF4124 domain-containing protein [Methylomonas sp.]PPD36613.1 MAG: DUF4124 domain-containing protein [Methylomonas sp.]PPD39918.1 MAG: DUF4124 domain-containing protein [Methylomonas sp.]